MKTANINKDKEKEFKNFIIDKVKSLCAPAYGCTEIGAIGYSVAAAASKVKGNILDVKSIVVEMSTYIFKNVMHVGVPNLGPCGPYTIASTGAAIADPKNKLEIFQKVTEEQKQIGKKLEELGKIYIKFPKKCNPVYVKTTIKTKNNSVIESLIAIKHDNLVYLKVDGKNLIKNTSQEIEKDTKNVEKFTAKELSVEKIIDLVNLFSEKELSFLEDYFKLNIKISEYGKKHLVDGSYAKTYKKFLKKDSGLNNTIIYDLAAAVDARMNGASIPAMSSCGSGDHGLTATIPQYTYHRITKNNRLTFLRSLLLSNLLVWKIKDNIGSLSCMCGSVVAAGCAATASIAFQMNLSKQQICNLMEMWLCSFNSSMCDGAKLSCTHKICTAMLIGLHLIEMCKNNYSVRKLDGVVCGNINNTLKLFKKMSKENSYKYNKSIVNGMNKMSQRNI